VFVCFLAVKFNIVEEVK